ncbi:MAG: HAD family hydrolase [Candidatus Zixiibacteriota bacterium]|nr:MAG: HAD family hydrolase [candidate division Zixibacteria bacterium]
MNKLKPKAVIFDLGSTLIEYEAKPWSEQAVTCAASVRKFLDRQGHPVPEDEEFFRIFEDIKNDFRKHAAESLTEWTVPQAAERLLGKLGIEADDGMADKLFDAYYQPVGKLIYAYDDVLDVLARIRKSADAVGLVSNTIFPERAHMKELRRFKIEPYLDFCIFSSTFGLRKPHPDIFYKAANCAGYAPAECIYIGDRYVEDFQGPSQMGMPAVLKVLPWREYPTDMPDDIPTISCLSDLDKYLDI